MTRKQVFRQTESGETRNHPQSGDEASCKAQSLDKPIKIRVLTHNIRYATKAPFKGEERWPIRCPRLCSALVFNSMSDPETFVCLQEVLHLQLIDILTSLNQSSEAGGEWAYIGVGRDDGKEAGEYSPIFYRPSIWHLKEWYTCWLSETPLVPSKGWDAASTRIATMGKFVHYKTGQLVLMVSTHLDDQGAQSRRESVKLILERLSAASEFTTIDAVLIAGDFNSPPQDEAYQIMTGPDSCMLDVSGMVAKEKRYGNEMTFTGFDHVNSTPSRIDYIFARKGDKINFVTYAVLANLFDDGVYSSDHRACAADLQLLP